MLTLTKHTLVKLEACTSGKQLARFLAVHWKCQLGEERASQFPTYVTTIAEEIKMATGEQDIAWHTAYNLCAGWDLF